MATPEPASEELDFEDGDDWCIYRKESPSDLDEAKAWALLRAILLKNDAKAVEACLAAGGKCWQAKWWMDTHGGEPGPDDRVDTVLGIAELSKNPAIVELVAAKFKQMEEGKQQQSGGS